MRDRGSGQLDASFNGALGEQSLGILFLLSRFVQHGSRDGLDQAAYDEVRESLPRGDRVGVGRHPLRADGVGGCTTGGELVEHHASRADQAVEDRGTRHPGTAAAVTDSARSRPRGRLAAYAIACRSGR